MRDRAYELVAAGISVVPVSLLTKRPLCRWGTYMKRLPTSEEIDRWFSRGGNRNPVGIGLVTGVISRLLAIDIDEPATVRKLSGRLVDDFGLSLSRTPRGGAHYLFRTADSSLLNRRNCNNEGIELKGSGGSVIEPPSWGYREIVPFSPMCFVARQSVHEILQLCGLVEIPRQSVVTATTPSLDCMLSAGWRLHSQTDNFIYLTRPNSRHREIHASVHRVSGRVTVFTTRSPLGQGRYEGER